MEHKHLKTLCAVKMEINRLNSKIIPVISVQLFSIAPKVAGIAQSLVVLLMSWRSDGKRERYVHCMVLLSKKRKLRRVGTLQIAKTWVLVSTHKTETMLSEEPTTTVKRHKNFQSLPNCTLFILSWFQHYHYHHHHQGLNIWVIK